MINIGSTNLGKTIRTLRETRGISRAELAEMVNISESHLKKIEAGTRNPEMNTYQKIMDILESDIITKNGEKRSVKGNCVMKAQEILMDCTETQALYLVKVLEFSAQNIKFVNRK